MIVFKDREEQLKFIDLDFNFNSQLNSILQSHTLRTYRGWKEFRKKELSSAKLTIVMSLQVFLFKYIYENINLQIYVLYYIL